MDTMPMVYDSPKSKNESAVDNFEGDGGKPIFAIMSSKNYSANSEQKLENSDKFENLQVLNSNEECQI